MRRIVCALRASASPLLLVSIVSACSVSFPVTGLIGDETAQGAATASTNGGTFYVVTLEGLRCDGTYDAFSTEPTIQSSVSCNDGRSGVLLITRDAKLTSGIASGRLNDGTSGRFVFGDISFEQAFGPSAVASTN